MACQIPVSARAVQCSMFVTLLICAAHRPTDVFRKVPDLRHSTRVGSLPEVRTVSYPKWLESEILSNISIRLISYIYSYMLNALIILRSLTL